VPSHPDRPLQKKALLHCEKRRINFAASASAWRLDVRIKNHGRNS
jgi:hypothetical protein